MSLLLKNAMPPQLKSELKRNVPAAATPGAAPAAATGPSRPPFLKSNLLDFKSPWPAPLGDPDDSTGCLDALARNLVDNLGQFHVECISLYPQLPAPMQEAQRFALWDCHRLLRLFQGHSTFYQPHQSTAFRRQRVMVPAAPQLLRLEEKLVQSEEILRGIPESVYSAVPPAEGLVHMQLRRLQFVVAPATGSQQISLLDEFRATRQALSRITAIFGAPWIWAKRPQLSRCQAIGEAWRNGDEDFENFLVWFREHELGLMGNQLDSYLAQILLGMRVSAKGVALSGHPDELVGCPEDTLVQLMVAKARRRKYQDENGKGFVTLPASIRQVPTDLTNSVEELVEVRYPRGGWREPNTITLEDLTRTDFERVGRKAGLSKEHSRYLDRWVQERVCERENPSARVAIRRRRDLLVATMHEDPKFGRFFG